MKVDIILKYIKIISDKFSNLWKESKKDKETMRFDKQVIKWIPIIKARVEKLKKVLLSGTATLLAILNTSKELLTHMIVAGIEKLENFKKALLSGTKTLYILNTLKGLLTYMAALHHQIGDEIKKLKNNATQMLSKEFYVCFRIGVVAVIGAVLVYNGLWTTDIYAHVLRTFIVWSWVCYTFNPIFKNKQEQTKHVPYFYAIRDLRLFGQKGKYTDAQLTPYWGVATFFLFNWVVYSTFYAFVLHNSWYMYFNSLVIGYFLHLVIFLWMNRFLYGYRYMHEDLDTHIMNMYGLSQFSPYILNGGLFLGFFISALPPKWPVDFSPVERLNDTRDWRLEQKTGPTILAPFKHLYFPLTERRVGVTALQILNEGEQKCQDNLVFDAVARLERFETGPNKVAIVAATVVPLQAGVAAEKPNPLATGLLNSDMHQNVQNFNVWTSDDENVKKSAGDFKEEKTPHKSNRDQNNTPSISPLTAEDFGQLIADAITAKNTNQTESSFDKVPVIETQGQCELLDETNSVKMELINILNKFPSTVEVHGRTTIRTFDLMLGFNFPDKTVWDELGGGLKNCTDNLTILKENYQVAKMLDELSLEGEKAYLEMEKEINILLHNINMVYIVEGTKRWWLRLC